MGIFKCDLDLESSKLAVGSAWRQDSDHLCSYIKNFLKQAQNYDFLYYWI
jgi:hypothetical protein